MPVDYYYSRKNASIIWQGLVLEEMGSPFCENSSTLLVLDSRGTLQVEGQLDYVFITAVGCPL